MMNKKKILVAVLAILSLTSCSIHNQTASLSTSRLIAVQQPCKTQPDAKRPAPVYAHETVTTTSDKFAVDINTNRQVQQIRIYRHVPKKVPALIALSNLVKDRPFAIASIKNTTIHHTSTASVKKNPFEGWNYLVAWIICLVLAVLFLALAGLPIIGLLFEVLGFIAIIFFVIFLIFWILQIMA